MDPSRRCTPERIGLCVMIPGSRLFSAKTLELPPKDIRIYLPSSARRSAGERGKRSHLCRKEAGNMMIRSTKEGTHGPVGSNSKEHACARYVLCR
jgi:hypothetical protein